MNVIGINFESIVDGDGVRVVIYFAGCVHGCKGCHNPESHKFDCGREFTKELQQSVIDYIKRTPFISGLTLSGGDPMCSAREITPFVQGVRNSIQNISIWIYTGYTFEYILESSEMLELLKLCDVLVDGKFILEQRDMTIPYRGSRNQRIIDIQKSLAEKQIIIMGD